MAACTNVLVREPVTAALLRVPTVKPAVPRKVIEPSGSVSVVAVSSELIVIAAAAVRATVFQDTGEVLRVQAAPMLRVELVVVIVPET